MKFYVEAEMSLGIRDEDVYRLQTDDTWRCLAEGKGFESTDNFFSDLKAIKPYLARNSETVLGTETYNANPSPVSFPGPLGPFVSPRVKRDKKPKIPSKSDLITTIAGGRDDRVEHIVIDLYGNFGLVENPGVLDQTIGIAAYHTSLSPNDMNWSGAQDQEFVNEIYIDMLDAWTVHLIRNRLNVCVDTCNQTENELLAEIDKLTANFP